MFLNSSFYKFFDIKKSQLKDSAIQLSQKAKELEIKGLALLSQEGLNASFCGQTDSIALFKPFIENFFKQDFFWKDSFSEKQSFKRFSVKIKKNIINIGEICKAPKKESGCLPPQEWENKSDCLSSQKWNKKSDRLSSQKWEKESGCLSPQEWENKLKEKKIQVLDLRNNYETDLGYFESAQRLNLKNFQEFSQKLQESSIDKKKETLIYCTGGIRCEKAITLMKDQGFEKVYQLNGGILNYLKYFPHSKFKKDCFVFDHRVALNQNLEASEKYSLCPHCGQPGNLKITCSHCEAPAIICLNCKNRSNEKETCSKNCSYHFKSGHICKKKHQEKKYKKTLRK